VNMKHIRISESYIKGSLSLEERSGALRPWRLPHTRKTLFPSPEENLLANAVKPAGVRLHIETDTRRLVLLAEAAPHKRTFVLCLGAEIYDSASLPAQQSKVEFCELPPGKKTVTVWLPGDAEVWLTGLELDDDATLEPGPSEGKKWITYGSSITHCARSHSPAETWPSFVARQAELDLTCLGFGGECHLDPMIAREIGNLQADIISLKVGINVYGKNSLNARTFKPAIIGFIETIREKHPTTPLALISPIIAPTRERTPNNVDFTLEAMRQEVADAAKRIQHTNHDHTLYYFDGRLLFGNELASAYLPDNLHPDAEGNLLMGKNFLENVLGGMAY